MKNLRERWRGLTVLGVVAFAAVCMTVAPAPSFADIAGGGGGGGPITEWCSDGRPKTGLVRCEDGNLRYFDPETGAMVTNQWHNEYEAVWYYFGADGIAVSGWQSIGGDKYYFYPESHDMAYGRVQIDGKNYFLNTLGANADGRMQHSGWLYDSIYGKWFYATSSGELLTGWHNIGGTWYYFDEYGVMLTGWINVSGTWYYANASGAMATGWLNIGGTWYYLDGSGAMVANSWRSLGGSWYWFGDSGAMATGWFLAGGSWYYASGSGAMATGWLSNGGTWYWLGGSGAMASNSWANVGGVWYWFDDSGAMVTGWRQVGGAWYYFSGSGAMAHDAWVGDYYLQSSGAMFANGWLKIDGVDYYFNASGAWLNTSGSVLGVNRSSLVNWLMSHENDGYYRGTRYDTHLSQETCMYPKGDPRWDGYTGMNCGGFVSHAYMKAGGNLAPIAAEQSHSPWSGGPGRGGCVNAYRWYGYAIDTCANVTYFNSIDELLRSGLARKGDIVFFNPYNPYADDSHIGFFWGNSPSENLFWHSDGYGNRISGLTALGPSKVILIR